MDLPAGQLRSAQALSAGGEGGLAGVGRHGRAGDGGGAGADQPGRCLARGFRTLRASGGTGGSASRGTGAIARAIPAVPRAGLRAGDA